MMSELDCVDILNMDGGGSTEMTARRAGSDSLATVSYPSDGGSRLVSNSLEIISNAPRTSEVSQVLVDGNVNIYPGSETNFSVRLTDPAEARWMNPHIRLSGTQNMVPLIPKDIMSLLRLHVMMWLPRL